MKLEQFRMERMQSTWENIVRYNLSESGVHPATIGELIPEPSDREELLRLELGYGQSNGTPELRRLVAATYPGATEDHVLVTTGTVEANFLAAWSLIEPGDEVIMMLPNYMQLWGLFRSFGAEVRPFYLSEDRSWAPDLDALDRAVTSRTRLITVCNPNNPTGAILSGEEMSRIVEAARGAGAWLLADEVYRGAERERESTPSFWGRYDRVIVTSGLSKAYGLPGLRIGWMVAPPEVAQTAWSYHDYTTIGPSAASDFLARVALQPDKRKALLERTRAILRKNYPVVREWIDRRPDVLAATDPEAGAIAYIRYNLDIDSVELVEGLRKSRSVLIVPGAHFEMGSYLRIGFGSSTDILSAGLELIGDYLDELR